MPRVRLTVNDNSPATAKKLEQTLADYFPIKKLEKVASYRWYLYLPESYNWTQKDADLMNNLIEQQDYLDGWHYQH
jgi:hypothetical protein